MYKTLLFLLLLIKDLSEQNLLPPLILITKDIIFIEIFPFVISNC